MIRFVNLPPIGGACEAHSGQGFVGETTPIQPWRGLRGYTYLLFFLEIILKIFHNSPCQKHTFLIYYFEKKYNSSPTLEKKGGLMDPKLVRQFIIFLIILFGWTVVVLLAVPK
jgi:hypothetical protein